MAKKPTLTDLTSQYAAQSTINNNNTAIENAFDNTLSRDGSTPNQMEADFDLNSNNLLNANIINTDSLILNGVDLSSLLAPAGPKDSETQVRVTTDYDTFQEAFDVARTYSSSGVYGVTVYGDSGQEWDSTGVNIRGDYTGISLDSAGSTITVPADFDDTTFGLNVVDAMHGLTVKTKLDMDGNGRGGINALDSTSSILFEPGSGVINSGNGGDDPKGANLMTSGKVLANWDADTQTGADFSGSSTRGVWITYGGTFGGKYCDFSGTGTSRDIGDDHAAAFVSRGSTFWADNSDFSGSKMGIRAGRSFGGARDSDFSNIDGYAAFAFEDGKISIARSTFTNSGYYDGVSETWAVLFLGGSTENRPQGGGSIQAESSTFNDVEGHVAECVAANGSINIDNCSGTGLEDHVGVCSGGLISIRASTFTASATCRAGQMLQSSNDGDIEALGVTLNGNSQVPYIARVADGGRISLKGATISGASDKPFAFGTGGGEIYIQETTINGTEYFADGVRLGDDAIFVNRDDAVTAVDFNFILADGKTFTAAGLRYMFLAGATVIPDMPGVVPVYPSQPEHFGADGDGSTNDRAALVSWASYGGTMAMTEGATYRVTDIVSEAAQIAFKADSFVSGNGATIQFEETDTTNNFRLLANAGTTLSNLRFYFTDNSSVGHYFERTMSVQDNVNLIDVTFEAETEQPDTTDDSGFDTCLRIDGSNVTIRGTKFINIWDCCRAQPSANETGFRAYDTEISGYSSGFTLAEFDSDVMIDGLRVTSINSGADTNPGENAITGGCTNLSIRNVEVWASGEHAIYLSSGGTLSSPVYGLTLENIRVRSSGQCAIKIRGWADVILRNVWGANAAMGNTAGTNDDGFRIEECTNVKGWDLGHGNEDDTIATGTGSGGYDSLHVDSSTEVDLYDVHLGSPQRAVVRIEDSRVEGSVDGIRIHGLAVINPQNPILDISVTGDIGDVLLSGVDARGATDDIVQISAGGSVGRIYVGGDITTSGSILDDNGGGESVIIDTGADYYVGGQSNTQALYVSASGTGEGFSSGDPMSLDDFWDYAEEQARFRKPVWFRGIAAAGTYTISARKDLSDVNWITPGFKISLEGPDTSGSTPTAIIDGQGTTNNFIYKDGPQFLHLELKDLYLQDFTDSAIDLQYNSRLETENVWGLDNAVSTVRVRSGQVDMLGGEFTGTSERAVIAQDCYGAIGDDVGVPGTHPMVIDGTSAAGVQVSRGSVMYVRGVTFGSSTAVADCIETDRISRVREQGNTIGASGFTGKYINGNGIVQVDLSSGDLVDASNISFGQSMHPAHAGYYHSGYMSGGIEPKGHMQYKAAAIAFPTDATRTNLTSGAGTRLFTMPSYWLFSETSKAEFTLSFLMNANESATFEITGSGPGANDVIMSFDIPAHTANVRWTVHGWFTGPCDPGTENRGRCGWHAFGRSGGSTFERWDSNYTDNDLNDTAISDSSSEEFSTRLYITLGGTVTGGGELQYIETKVNF